MPTSSDPLAGTLKVEVSREGDAMTLALAGEFDLATVDAVREKLTEANRSPRMVIDLRELTFIDSTGIALLLSVVQEDGERRLSFIPCGSPSVQRVLSMTGVAEVFGGGEGETNGAK